MTPVFVIRTGALGDFLLTLPLLRCLAATGAPLHLVSRAAYRPLLPPALRTTTTFIDLDSAAGVSFFADSADSPAAGSDALSNAVVHVFAQPDAAMGRTLQRRGVRHLVWHDPRPVQPPHATARFLAHAGFAVPPDLLETPHCASASPRGRTLWVHPGSGSARKNLAPGIFAEFARLWQRESQDVVQVSFGEADTAVRRPMLEALMTQGVAHRVVEDLSLAALADRMREEAALCIGNDSGVSHLAAALGIPTLAFFKVTAPEIWRPLGPCLPVPPAETLRAETDGDARLQLWAAVRQRWFAA